MKTITITGERRWYWELEYFRGFSIFAIVVMHVMQGYRFTPLLPRIVVRAASFAGAGGHVFILCSGFGLYASQLRRPLSFPAFLKRRFFKIYLPYILVIFLSFCLSFVFPWIYDEPDKLQALCSHVFLYKMFSSRYELSFGNQMWFISTIIQFYLLSCPLFFAAKKLGLKRLFLLSLAASLLWWIFLYCAGLTEERIWSSFFLQYLWEFVLGFVCADSLGRGRRFSAPVPVLILAAVGFLGLYALLGLSDLGRIVNDVPALFCYLSLLMLGLGCLPEAVLRFFRWVGSVSYELFLVHLLVFNLVFDLVPPLRTLPLQLAVSAAAIALSLPAAWLYHRFLGVLTRRRSEAAVSGAGAK